MAAIAAMLKRSSARPAVILLVEAPHRDTAEAARVLATAGLHVFWTAATVVALRLSREFFFDVVLLDATAECDDPRALAAEFQRHGHRSVILTAADDEWPPLGGQWNSAVEGALRRPLDVPRFCELARALVRSGDLDAFRRGLDLTR